MKILSSWDDGSIHDKRMAELMSKYDIETTFYVPVMWQKVNTLKRRYSLSLDELQEIAKVHTIGSHTISHPHLTAIQIDDAYTEIYDSKKMLEDLIDKPVTSFCYPRGYYNDSIKEMVVAAGYSDARTTKVGYLSSADPYETHTAVHVGYPRREYEGKHWAEYAAELINSNNTDDKVFHFWGHSEEIDRFNQWDNLELFLKALKS